MRRIFIMVAVLVGSTGSAFADLPGSSQPSDGATQRRIGSGVKAFVEVFFGGLEFKGDYAHERPSRLTIEGQIGLATPLGLGGFSASVAATQWLDVAFGVGKGSAGVQIAAMARVHPRDHGRRGFFGIGVSQGDYEGFQELGTIAPAPTLQNARWLNVESGQEFGKLGFFARLSLGLGWRFSDGGCLVDGVACQSPPKLFRVMPYFGWTLGYRY